MERFTEKFKDGRNILRKGITDIFHIGFGRFFEGESIDKLAEYEDLEEQGKLLKLPCSVGDTVYRIVPKTYRKITKLKIKEFVVCENGLCFRTDKTNFGYSCDEFGEYIFLTKSAVEQALKEMEGKK